MAPTLTVFYKWINYINFLDIILQKKCKPKYLTHLSAPAHDNILLILITWKGWSLIRIWNWSLPQFFTKYLLAQIRPASKASELSCSYSSETKCTHRGKSSTVAFFLPKSKIRILGSGTPLQNRDLGYGLFLQ